MCDAVAGVLKKKSQSVEGVAVDAVVKDSLRFLIQFLERRREQYHSVPVRLRLRLWHAAAPSASPLCRGVDD